MLSCRALTRFFRPRQNDLSLAERLKQTEARAKFFHPARRTAINKATCRSGVARAKTRIEAQIVMILLQESCGKCVPGTGCADNPAFGNTNASLDRCFAVVGYRYGTCWEPNYSTFPVANGEQFGCGLDRGAYFHTRRIPDASPGQPLCDFDIENCQVGFVQGCATSTFKNRRGESHSLDVDTGEHSALSSERKHCGGLSSMQGIPLIKRRNKEESAKEKYPAIILPKVEICGLQESVCPCIIEACPHARVFGYHDIGI